MTRNNVYALSRAALVAAFLLNLLSTAHSIVADRQLIQDGSWWIFRILNENATSFGSNKLRYLTAAFEYPSLLVARFFTSGDQTGLIVRVWEIGLALNPYISLALCFFILRSAGRLELMLLPLLSFAIASQIAIVFAANQSAEVLSIFWVILALLACCDLRKKRVIAGISFGVLLLCISHESALFVFLFLGLVAFLGMRRHSRLRRTYLFLGVLFLLGALECVARTVIASYQTEERLIQQTVILAARFQVQVLVVIGMLVLRAVGARHPRFHAIEIQGYLVLSLAAIGFAVFGSIPNPTAYLNARLLAVFLGILIGAYFWAASEAELPRGLPFKAALTALVTAVLIYSARADYAVTSQWTQGTAIIRAVAASKGCHPVDTGVFARAMFPTGITNVYLPVLSLVLQKRKTLESILFTNHQWSKRDPGAMCRHLEEEGCMTYFFEVPLHASKYFTSTAFTRKQ